MLYALNIGRTTQCVTTDNRVQKRDRVIREDIHRKWWCLHNFQMFLYIYSIIINT